MAKVITSTDRFRRLYDLTMAICKTDEEINYRSLVQKKHERWKVLADIWAKNKRKFCSNIFYNPIRLIICDSYLTSTTKKSIALTEEIKDALLYDEEALLAWSETKEFNKAFSGYIKSAKECPFVAQFQFSQALIRIFYTKHTAGSQYCKNKIEKFAELYEIDFKECELIIDIFKKIIWMLLPHSEAWSYEQWCNNIHICDEINKKYNSNFQNLYEDFVPVFYLVACDLGEDIPLDSILPAKAITPGIVKAIFKEDTDSFVYDTFCKINEALSEDDMTFLLADSWMFEIMKSWTNDEKHPCCNAVKKTVFDIIMQKTA